MSTANESERLVSVILLTIDRFQYLDCAIESVCQQSFREWEMVIVQDGCDSQVEAALQRWAKREPRIRYFRRPRPGNIANAINYGIAQSRGVYIAILDDDDAWIHRDKLRLQLDFIEMRDELLCVGGGAIVVDQDGNEMLRYHKPASPADCARRALIANPLIHSSVLYRKRAVIAAGLYDEGLAGYQDWDLWLRMMRVGQVANLQEHFVMYRIWNGGGSSRNVLANAWSGLQIVCRHRRHYRGYILALAAAFGYVVFAVLPTGARRRCYQQLTRFKKRIFAVSG